MMILSWVGVCFFFVSPLGEVIASTIIRQNNAFAAGKPLLKLFTVKDDCSSM
jgi:hypothetical protein